MTPTVGQVDPQLVTPVPSPGRVRGGEGGYGPAVSEPATHLDDRVRGTPTRRAPVLPSIALVVAPIVFAGGWALAGASIDGFSPVRFAVSDLAGVDSSTRWPMFAVFVTYGLAMLIASRALAAVGARGSAVAAVLNGLSVLGVAAFPVHGSGRGDAIHGVFALIGYLSITAIMALAVRPLFRSGHRGAAVASVVFAVVCAGALAGTTGSDHTGLFQRVGTTTGDIWMVAAGTTLLLAGVRRPRASP